MSEPEFEAFEPQPKKERLAALGIEIEATNIKVLEPLLEEIKATREAYVRALATGLMKQPGPVDQREIDYKRGFWQGAIWATLVLPQQAAAALDKQRKADDAVVEEATA
jgi:hypothetical protein